MWRSDTHSGDRHRRSNRPYQSLLRTVGFAALAIATGTYAIGQEATTATERLTDSDAAVQGQPQRISDWALAGVIWSDAHLVRKLARREAAQTNDSRRVETMSALVQDADQIIDILQDFGWQHLEARREELATREAAAEAEADRAAAVGTDEVVEPQAAVPTETLPQRVETESPPGLNDPGVDDELQASALAFDLRHYRVDDYLDEVPVERRSLADAVEDGVEGALAAGVDNIARDERVDRGEGREARRRLATRSDSLPYSRDSIYSPEVEYDIVARPNEPVPDTNPLVERTERRTGEGALDAFPKASDDASSNVPEVDGEDDLTSELVQEGEIPAAGSRIAAARDTSDLRRFTELREQFAQDAAWVQFRFDSNQRIWQMVQAQPPDQPLRPVIDVAIAQLQAHAQVGERLTDDRRLATILRLIGRGE